MSLESERQRAERDAIMRALDANNGNRTNAAKDLGVSLSTLKRRLALYESEGVNLNKTATALGWQVQPGPERQRKDT